MAATAARAGAARGFAARALGVGLFTGARRASRRRSNAPLPFSAVIEQLVPSRRAEQPDQNNGRAEPDRTPPVSLTARPGGTPPPVEVRAKGRRPFVVSPPPSEVTDFVRAVQPCRHSVPPSGQ